jgi:solute carrier family 35, member E3
MMAALLNISQFFIVAGAGPVSSTVVGHLKTCSIVALGWITTGRGASDRGLFGIFMALTGIIMYVMDLDMRIRKPLTWTFIGTR